MRCILADGVGASDFLVCEYIVVQGLGREQIERTAVVTRQEIDQTRRTRHSLSYHPTNHIRVTTIVKVKDTHTHTNTDLVLSALINEVDEH